MSGHTGSALAFPSGDFGGVQPENGLTKRELFAVMAMQGFAANPKIAEIAQGQDMGPWLTQVSIRCADDLLAHLQDEVTP